MTWTTVYLVCFLLGFSLSAVSWLLGALHLHPHLHLHLPHAGHGSGGAPAHGHSGHGGHSAHDGHGASAHHGGAPSPFNVATLTAFLAWFGGAGYLLSRYADIWPLAALLLAIIVGCGGASLVFWVMAKVLWAADENLDPDDYEMVGLLGVVSSPIRAGGTGEVIFSQAGARRGAGARSEDGGAIGKGVEVVITRHHNGLVYVRTWTDLAADERLT
jgi:membrane protein implicated in regulation of membrane protease activity